MTNPRPVYAATLYHDTEFNADERNEDIGYFATLEGATRAINARRDDYWQTGGIQYGFLHAPVFGKSPEWFESDESNPGSWFVGTDGMADR